MTLKVWMQNTDATSLTTTKTAESEMTLVFDGSVDYAGGYTVSPLNINFTTSFTYESGKNLRVVVSVSECKTEIMYTTSLDNTIGAVGITYGYWGNLTNATKIPYIELIYSKGGVTPVATYNVTGTAPTGAAISLNQSNEAKYTATAISGSYTIADVKEGTYTVKATCLGYEDYEGTLTVSGGDATHNITMAEVSDFTISSFNIRAAGTVGQEYKATVTLTSAFADARTATAELYIGGNKVATAEKSIASGATEEIGLAYTPAAAAENVPVYIKVGNVQTNTVNVSFTEEEVEIIEDVNHTVGSGDGSNSYLMSGVKSYNESVYLKEGLGLNPNAKITQIGYKYYNFSGRFKGNVKIYLENTTDDAPTTTLHATDGMTLVYDKEISCGSSYSQADLNMNLGSKAFTYTGGNLRVIVVYEGTNCSATWCVADPDTYGRSFYGDDPDNMKEAGYDNGISILYLHVDNSEATPWPVLSGKAPEGAVVTLLEGGEVKYTAEPATAEGYSIKVLDFDNHSFELNATLAGYMPYTPQTVAVNGENVTFDVEMTEATEFVMDNTSFTVDSEELTVGSELTASVALTSYFADARQSGAELYVNNVKVATDDTEIAAGETKTISFTYTGSAIGTFPVYIQVGSSQTEAKDVTFKAVESSDETQEVTVGNSTSYHGNTAPLSVLSIHEWTKSETIYNQDNIGIKAGATLQSFHYDYTVTTGGTAGVAYVKIYAVQDDSNEIPEEGTDVSGLTPIFNKEVTFAESGKLTVNFPEDYTYNGKTLRIIVVSDVKTSSDGVRFRYDANRNLTKYSKMWSKGSGEENVETMDGDFPVTTFAYKLNIADVTLAANTTFEAPENDTYANVTITRNMAEGWNTFCVPFDVASDDAVVRPSFDKVYTFGGVEVRNGNYVILFNKLEEGATMEANTPYVVYMANRLNLDATVLQTTVKAGGAKSVGENEDFQFVGNYEANKNAKGLYGITADATIMKGGETANINCMSAYFQLNIPEGAKIVNRFDDEIPTSINEEFRMMNEESIYDLQGRRIGERDLRKGIYVKNGKKFMVK